MKLQLPAQVSVNQMYKNARRGRVKTDKYKAWIIEAGWELKKQVLAQKKLLIRTSYLGKLVDLKIRVRKKDKRKRDIDNTLKCIFDLLTTHQIITDDEYIEHFDVGWFYDGPDGVSIDIWEYGR